MTADHFTEAARAEAEDYARTPRMNVGTVRDRIAEAHLAGAAWGREQALAQEPTDAEVEAAARAIYAEDVNESYIEWPAYDSPQNVGRELYTERARNALSAARAAARAARRDEEKR